MLPRQGEGDVADFLATAGSMVDRRPPEMAKLVIEAIVASGRDPEVARLVRSWLTAGEELLAATLRVALEAGAVDIDVEPETISRLATIIGLGSYLTGALGVGPAGPRRLGPVDRACRRSAFRRFHPNPEPGEPSA